MTKLPQTVVLPLGATVCFAGLTGWVSLYAATDRSPFSPVGLLLLAITAAGLIVMVLHRRLGRPDLPPVEPLVGGGSGGGGGGGNGGAGCGGGRARQDRRVDGSVITTYDSGSGGEGGFSGGGGGGGPAPAHSAHRAAPVATAPVTAPAAVGAAVAGSTSMRFLPLEASTQTART